MMNSEVGSVNAILLAGNSKKDSLLEATGVVSKALLPLPSGTTMLEQVLSALRQCPSIGRIVVVGDPSLEDSVQASSGEFQAQGDSLIANLLRGFAALEWPEQCVVSTCDIPLVTPEAFSSLIGAGREHRADIVYPVTKREVCEQRFPGGHRTYARLKDGTFTGGNAMWMNGKFVNAQQEALQDFFEARKSPLKLCRLIGLRFLILFLTRQLSIEDVERRIDQLFGCRARAFLCDYPEMAFDVDKPEDLEMVSKYINNGGVT